VDPFLALQGVVGSLLAFFATQPLRERLEKKQLVRFTSSATGDFVEHMQDMLSRGLAKPQGGIQTS
jgi:hypothetical protein